jgi:hypothetical protein
MLGESPDQNYIEINPIFLRKYIVRCIEGYVSILDKDLNIGTYRYIGTALSCMSTYGHKKSPLHPGNKLIWKLPCLILCPIEIIGMIYGKCVTFKVCFKNIYIYSF